MKAQKEAGRGWVELDLSSGGHSENQATSPPCLSCQVADSEAKAGTLQLTVERLSGALAKMEESEGVLRDKVQGLTETLAQNSASLTSTQDKNLQLQKALKACEHDRQVLQVWGFSGSGWGRTQGELVSQWGSQLETLRSQSVRGRGGLNKSISQ